MQNKIFMSKNGAVATEHPLASLAALHVLRSGGNAIDAATAAGFSLAVCQPHLGGLGGDFFALCREQGNKNVHCLNSSGWAPSGVNTDTVRAMGQHTMPVYGPLTAVIPGHVKGLFELHRKFGTIEFSKLISYAIELCKGFPIYAGLSRGIQLSLDSLPDSAKKIYAPNGKALQAGETLKQEDMASVLTAISKEGPSVFYEGWIAEKTAAKLREAKIPVEPEDFSKFEPEWCKPIQLNYRGVTIYEVPPNSMGPTTLFILKSLDQHSLDKVEPNSSERIATTLDAVKEAYSRRDTVLGDPRFVKFDLDDFLSRGSDPDRLTEVPVRAIGGDTTYFATIDKEGNMVSGIQSLFHHFGSKVFIEGCGFFLNNRGSGFKLDGPNKIEPRKRPLHTLSALLVAREGDVKMALGASGGEYRPQQHALFVTNLVDYKMSLEEALAYPRFLWDGNKVMVEDGYTNVGHLNHVENIPYPGRTGVAQGVEAMENGVRKAVCDIRGEGLPIGP